MIPKTLNKQKGFIGAIIGGIGGIMGGKATEDAAETAARSKDLATKESRRQFDITRSQLEPFRLAGLRGLEAYERMLPEYERDIPSNLPEAYVTPKDLPAMYDFQAGDYFDRIESDIPDQFAYGEEDFMASPGRATRASGGLEALEGRNIDMEKSGLAQLNEQLANREYRKSRDRAYQDYQTDVSRETERYGRGLEEYGRLTDRERELYGRERQSYLDAMGREAELARRDYRDYQTGVASEEETYRRALEKYGREYVDPLSRYAELAGIGQSTTTGLGGLRQSYSQTIGQNIADVGRLEASGELGKARAYATAIGNIGKQYGG